MAQRNVWFAMPAYTGVIYAETVRSMINDMLILAGRGDRVHIHDEIGNAMIADCRALIVAEFLASDADTLCFLDSDVSWQAGDLVKLIDQGVNFRVGIYPQRKDPLNFCVRWDCSKTELQADPTTGLLGIDGAPAGFMVLSRSCLQQLWDAHPELACWSDRVPQGQYRALFEPYWLRDVLLPDGSTGTVKLGEDYSFCQRWLDLGGRVWVDPEIVMGHTGGKMFVGSLGDWLREHNGLKT